MYMYRGDARCRQTSLSYLVGAPHIEQEASRNGGQITSVGDHELAVDVPMYQAISSAFQTILKSWLTVWSKPVTSVSSQFAAPDQLVQSRPNSRHACRSNMLGPKTGYSQVHR